MDFFKNKNFKNRTFSYRPRFYDADREELELRKKRKLDNDTGELTKLRLRQEFSYYKSSDGKRKSSDFSSSSSFRLIIIIAILSLGSYYILATWLPDMMEFWFPEEQHEVLDKYY